MYYSLADVAWYSSVHLAFINTLTLFVVHHPICVYLALLTASSPLLLTFSSYPAPSSSSARHPLITRPSFPHLMLQLLLNIINAMHPLVCQLLSPSKKSRRSSSFSLFFLVRRSDEILLLQCSDGRGLGHDRYVPRLQLHFHLFRQDAVRHRGKPDPEAGNGKLFGQRPQDHHGVAPADHPFK